MRVLRVFAAVPLVLFLTAGCGENSPPISPTSPSSVTAAGPTNSPTQSVGGIRGSVSDTAFRPLAGARVEVLDGVSAGVSALTDSSGVVTLVGTFDSGTRFRATLDGHETLTQTWTCSVPQCANNAQPWFYFQLRPLTPAVDLAGEYTLSVIADRSCTSLPLEAQTRTYAATVTPRTRPGTADVVGFNVLVHADAVLEPLRQFPIGVAGDYVRLGWQSGHGEEPGLIEHLGNNIYVAFTGAAAAAVGPVGAAGIALAFEGSIEHLTLRGAWTFPFVPPPGAVIAQQRCSSAEHRLLFNRR